MAKRGSNNLKNGHVNPFGTKLSKLPTTQTSNGYLVPIFVSNVISFLEQEGLQLEGIFRISGGSSKIQKLKSQIETGEKTTFTKKEDDPYDVACILKQFFRELPDPLCTWELYDCFIATQGFPPDHKLNAITKTLDLLPEINLHTMMYVCEFAHNIAQHSDVNKMGSANLAIVLAPSILRPQQDTIDVIIGDSQYSQGVMNSLVADFDVLFKKFREKLTTKTVIDQAEKTKLKEELSNKYVDLQAESIQKFTEEISKQVGNEEDLEKKIAEQAAKLSVGLVGEDVNIDTWDAEEYKRAYSKTLRGAKGFRNRKARIPSGKARNASFNIGRQRTEEETTEAASVSTPDEQVEQRKVRSGSGTKHFTTNANPMDLSKMYIGSKK